MVHLGAVTISISSDERHEKGKERKERKEREEKKERNGRETPGIVFPYRRPLVGAPSDVVV